MQGHEVHALLGLHLDFRKKFLGIDVGGIAILVDITLRHRIERHGAERQGRAGKHLPPDGHKVPGDGQVHDRIRPGLASHVELAHLAARMVLERRGADVGVDLHAARLAHENGFDVRMVGIAEQDHGPGFDGRGDGFGPQPLFFGQRGQMRGQEGLQGRILSDDGHEKLLVG